MRVARDEFLLWDAFDRIALGLSADADYFLTIAKLRAARAVWARIAAACDAEPTARIEAGSSRRMITAKDAWTNMIRLTAAGFAAGVGGADAVTLGAFTGATGDIKESGQYLGMPEVKARDWGRQMQALTDLQIVGFLQAVGVGHNELPRIAEAVREEIDLFEVLGRPIRLEEVTGLLDAAWRG